MARKPKLLEAKFEQVLLYLDGPQVILLSAVAGSRVMAVAIKEYEEYEYPFFAAQISDSQLIDYLQEKFDLRYLLMKPSSRRNFVLDLGTIDDGVVALKKEKITPENSELYLPDPGLFAREHTEKLNLEIDEPKSEQKFAVDGSWDLPEFSYFYNNVTDLYAFFNSIDMFLDAQTSNGRKEHIVRSFVKPFRGGGSYRGLYGSLIDAQPKGNRLHVSGISYNSPGFVMLRGFEKSFSEITNLILNFEQNSLKLSDAYGRLRQTLVKARLLRVSANRFVSDSAVANVIALQSKALASAMDVVSYDEMLVMAGNNTLIAAKVLLSVYRRASRLYEFFLEGRVSLGSPTSLT